MPVVVRFSKASWNILPVIGIGQLTEAERDSDAFNNLLEAITAVRRLVKALVVVSQDKKMINITVLEQVLVMLLGQVV